jgi:hypothetical protein
MLFYERDFRTLSPDLSLRGCVPPRPGDWHHIFSTIIKKEPKKAYGLIYYHFIVCSSLRNLCTHRRKACQGLLSEDLR